MVDRGDVTQENSAWRLKMTGKLLNGHPDDELLKGTTSHFMSYFDKVVVEFKPVAGQSRGKKPYETITWLKSQDKQGSLFDSFEIKRDYPKPKDDKKNEDSQENKEPVKPALNTIEGSIHLSLVNHPKKYRLSPTLQKILGLQCETRSKIVGALW